MIEVVKRLFYILTLSLLTACSLTINSASETTPAPEPAMETAVVIAAATANIPRSTPTSAPLGTAGNPLVLALSPGSASDENRVAAGKAFAEQLSEVTGYTFVAVAPDSYARLVQAMERGNVHVAVLSPYAYALAYKQGAATATFASVQSGEKAYGAQFIARTDAGFKSYFDASTGENRADAVSALSQFRDKKPCWPDEVSPSGYVIPAGILAHNEISLRTAAILQGQPAVVRAIYAGGICDFGATYIDARTFPTVLDEYPDVLEEVEVIWQVPPVIPYEVLAISPNMTPKIELSIRDALFRLTGMQAGRQALGQTYGIEEWEQITDVFYEEFRLYLDASGVDLENLTNYQS